jgi:hypothetical protein
LIIAVTLMWQETKIHLGGTEAQLSPSVDRFMSNPRQAVPDFWLLSRGTADSKT